MENIREKIRRRIKSDKTDKTVNAEKQNRHIRDSGGYIEGRSYLLDGVDAQELIKKYHGTGEAKFTETDKWKSKEVVDADSDIGVKINPVTGEETTTNRFTIHYSRTGVHIIPAERRKKNEALGIQRQAHKNNNNERSGF